MLCTIYFSTLFFLIDISFLGVIVLKQHIQMARSKEFSVITD